MLRRDLLKSAAAVTAMSVTGMGFSRAAFSANPTMTTVCKIIGVPYFTLLGKGLEEAGKKIGIESTMIGPAQVDPAQQVRLVEFHDFNHDHSLSQPFHCKNLCTD